MKNLLMFTALALVVGAPLALAKGCGEGQHNGKKGPHMMEKMFEHHDTNKDGVISKEEFMASAETRFTEADADGDGSITKKEMMEKHKERMETKHQERMEKHEEMMEHNDAAE